MNNCDFLNLVIFITGSHPNYSARGKKIATPLTVRLIQRVLNVMLLIF